MKRSIFLSLVFLLSVFHLKAQSSSSETIMTQKINPTTDLIQWPAVYHPKKAKWYVHNEIEINASPETVWKILIDAKVWHTFYQGVQSPVVYFDSNAAYLRKDLQFKLHTMGLKLNPIIKEFVPNERMAWEVRAKGLRAYHAWLIIPTEKGCRLITPESQNGFLTTLQKIFQPNKLLKLHDKWLKLIKEQAEAYQK